MNFSKNLIHFRKKKKLSQTDLSKMCNIPQTTLSDWERGKSEPGVANALKIARALDITISELLCDEASNT